MHWRLKYRLMIITCLLCALTNIADSLAEDELIIHGQSIQNDEDPKNSTATTESISIDPVEPTLGTVLENATGVGIRRSGNLGRSEFIQLRGTLGHQAQIRLEGVPLLFMQGQSINLSALPLALFDTVRVTRGGSSVDYGSGAQGGVVHLTHDPKKIKTTSGNVRVGSFGYTRVAALAPFTRGQDHVSVGFQLEKSDGDFHFEDLNGRTRTRENNDHTSANLFALGRWKVAKLGTLKLLLDNYTDERGEPGPMEFPNRRARSQTNRLISGLSVKLVPSLNGRLITDMMVFAQIRNMKFSDPAPSFVGDPTRFQMTDRSFSNAITTQFQFSPEVVISGHLETQHSQIKTRDSRKTAHDRTLSSVSANIEWHANQTFRITAGSRLQQSVQNPEVMPRLGSSLRLSDTLQLNANLSKFFRLPSLDELYFRGVGISGNPDLKPEKGHSADAGLLWQPHSDFLNAVSLHGFITDFDSLIFFAPIDAYRFQTENHPGGLILGTELMLNASVAEFEVHLSHRYQISHTQHDKHLPLPYRPPHLSRIHITRSIGPVSVNLSANQMSTQTIDVYGRRTLEGYREIDARIDVNGNQGWLMSVSATNLFDEKDHRDFPTLPRPGRSLLLLLSLSGI